MWNVIKTRNFSTMFFRQEDDYRVWIIEYDYDCKVEYEVIVSNLALDDVKTVFDKSGYASFNEAENAARQALRKIRYGA